MIAEAKALEGELEGVSGRGLGGAAAGSGCGVREGGVVSVGPDHMVRLRAPEGAIWRSDRSAPVVTYSDEMAYAFSWSDVLWHWAEQKEAFYSYLKTHRPDAFDAVLACVEEETGTLRDTIATNILDNLVVLNDCLAKLYILDLSSLFDVAVHGAHAHAAVKHLGITGQVFVNVKGGVEYLITKGYAGQRPAGSAIVGTRYKLNNPKLRMFAFFPLNELGSSTLSSCLVLCSTAPSRHTRALQKMIRN